MALPKFLLHILTEPDNQTFCPIRVSVLSGIATFFGLSIAAFHKTGAFDPQAWALGFGALITGAGAALKLKKDTPQDGGQAK